MSKHIKEEHQTVVEPEVIAGSPTVLQSQPIDHPKEGYFFPNQDEGLPFGGEFDTRAAAEEANKQYLAEQAKKKESK